MQKESPKIIKYDIGYLPHTQFIMGVCPSGVCVLLQDAPEEELLKEITEYFPTAKLEKDEHYLIPFMNLVLEGFKEPEVYKIKIEEKDEKNRSNFDEIYKAAVDKTLTLALYGTEFRKQVWAELCQIPYGKTATYSDIAHKINNPKGVRAVAQACGANPIPIIVPCHRVIGKDKKLTGYRGGLHLKVSLLDAEKAQYKK